MRLRFYRDDTEVVRQQRQNPSEARANGGAASVDQYQDFSFVPVDLVIHLDPVHRGIAGLRRRRLCERRSHTKPQRQKTFEKNSVEHWVYLLNYFATMDCTT